MKALTWHGRRDVRVDTVPDPTIEQPTDAIIRVTSTGLCGSDLHLYEVLGPFIERGRRPRPRADGHRRGGRRRGRPTSRPATASSCPFNISCGHCFMCEHGLQSQCETTQVRERAWAPRCSATPSSTARCPGGQAELLRVPQAQYGPIKVPEGPPDDRFLFLSDVLPTAWQAVQYADDPRRRQRRRDRPRARSARWPPRSPSTSAPARSSGSTSCPSAWPARSRHGVRDDRRQRRRRRAGGRARADRRPRTRRGHRRRRAWRPTARPAASSRTRSPACMPDAVARKVMETRRRRSPQRAAARDRDRPARRHGLALGRLRRHGRPAEHAADVRQAAHAADGPGQRPPLGRRHPAAADATATRSASTASPPTTSRSTEAPQAYETFQKKEDGAFKVVFKPSDG